MEQMYRDFGDIAGFFVIYINEAHPNDGPAGASGTDTGVATHRDYGQRCSAASRLLDETLMSIPCLVDDIDNSTDLAWRAWPDKVFVVNSEGIIAVAGADGPYGFLPALDAAGKWLQELRDTGNEPSVAQGKAPDFGTILDQLRPSGTQAEYLATIDRARAAWRQSDASRAATPPGDDNSRRDHNMPPHPADSANESKAASENPTPLVTEPDWTLWIVVAAAFVAIVLFFRAVRR